MATAAGSHLVGLDIGTTGIRAVELAWHRKQREYRIKKVGSVDLPRGVVRNGTVTDPKEVTKALKKLWRRSRFSTRKVAFGLADSSVLSRQLELPWMPTDDFRAALRYQVSDVLPVNVDSVELGYHLLGEEKRLDENQQSFDVNQILLVAVNSGSIKAITDVLRAAKLEPVVADSVAFALIRAACRGVMPESTETHAIVDLGADQMTVVIHQAGQPRFIRTITNIGGSNATEAVAERLHVEAEVAEGLKRQTGLNGPPPLVAPIAESSIFRAVAEEPTRGMDPRITVTLEVLSPWATTVIGEIRNSLDYFQASDPLSPIQTLTFAGRTVELQGFVERVATQIPLPVRTFDPVLGMSAPKKVRASHLEVDLVVAAGLAMGAVA